MGGLRDLLDALLGRSRLIPAKSEKLFALSTALETIRESLRWEPAGRSGLCLKPVVTGDYADAQQELAQLVRLGAGETHSRVAVEQDRYNYTWVLMEDPQFEDLLTLTHMAADTLEEKGYGTQILSAVFRFRPVADSALASAAPEATRLYLIYNYKRGHFYPFLPRGAGQGADDGRFQSEEFHVAALLGRDLPMESDPSRWYPIWDCPV